MPVRYTCIMLKTGEHGDLDGVTAAMRKRLVGFLFGKLAYFQDFDAVKIYYDDGQKSGAQAIHKAVGYAPSKDTVGLQAGLFLGPQAQPNRGLHLYDGAGRPQVADRASTAIDERFFGSWPQLKKGILKEVWAKRI